MTYNKQRPGVTPPQVGLAALRKSHGLTQETVAAEVTARLDLKKPFTDGALSAIEQGHRGTTSDVLRALEAVFRLDAGSLVVEYEPSHARRKTVA